MASRNPFGLLGDIDHDDPELALASSILPPPKAAPPATAKLPTKPLPPAQAVREARGRAPRGRGPVTGGSFASENGSGHAADQTGDDGDGGRTLRGGYSGPRSYRGGGRRGGYASLEVGGEPDRPRRVYERRSGTGRGTELKREGSGRGNWGTAADDMIAQGTPEGVVGTENFGASEKGAEQELSVGDGAKDRTADETKEVEKEEDKEMTLEEYQKVLEEKRKALVALKAEERKVELDKEFKSMILLSIKKENDDVFIKLGSDKDSRKLKDGVEKDERAKKHVSINEFLKPADGERYYRSGGRGRGRDRGDRVIGSYGFETSIIPEAAIKIEDTKQFPLLTGK